MARKRSTRPDSNPLFGPFVFSSTSRAMPAQKDPLRRHVDDRDSCPSQIHEVVAVSDTVDLAFITNRLWVGAAGSVRVLLRGDTVPVTLVGVAAGTMLELQVKRIYSTGTTVATPNTNLVALR